MLLFQILPGHDYAFDEADLEASRTSQGPDRMFELV